MKVRNLREAASLLKSLGCTERNPLVIPPTSFSFWFDSRHYADEISSDPYTAIWQKRGCVWARRQTDGVAERLQSVETYNAHDNYWDLEEPEEGAIVRAINKVREKRQATQA